MKNDLLDAYNSSKHIRKPHQYQKNDFFHVYLLKYEIDLTLYQYFYMYTYNSYIGLTLLFIYFFMYTLYHISTDLINIFKSFMVLTYEHVEHVETC